MNYTATVLVITGALIHATWNLLAKRASGGAPFVWLYGLVSLVVSIPFGLYGWYLDGDRLNLTWLVPIACSGAAHLVYSLALQRGYQSSDFSIVYPIARGSGPLFSVVAAIVLLHERPSAVGWLGISSVVLGIFWISDLVSSPLLRSERATAGIVWGAANGLSIAAYTVIDGWAVKALGIPPSLYYFRGLFFRTVLLAPKAIADIPALQAQWKVHRRYILGVGALAPLSYTLVLFAMTMAPLAYVAPARELSMLIGVLLGAKVLQESIIPRRLVGTGLMLLGVVMLTLAK
jgi:drug/metabolite transporter (DMT)-like permease